MFFSPDDVTSDGSYPTKILRAVGAIPNSPCAGPPTRSLISASPDQMTLPLVFNDGYGAENVPDINHFECSKISEGFFPMSVNV